MRKQKCKQMFIMIKYENVNTKKHNKVMEQDHTSRSYFKLMLNIFKR
jgi:hypothetical protein